MNAILNTKSEEVQTNEVHKSSKFSFYTYYTGLKISLDRNIMAYYNVCMGW